MTARSVGVPERRARLGRRHHLAAEHRADGPAGVADGVVALHATDPAGVYLAALARMRRAEIAAVERALYDDRSLVRMLGMRRTMFVVGVDLAPVVQAACTRTIAARERRRLVQHLEEAGVATDAGAWLADVEESAYRALEARGEATANELAAGEPRLRARLHFDEGKRPEARPAVTTRVLTLLAADGRIVRGRPRGGWTSSRYRWSTIDAWLPRGLPDLPAGAVRPSSPAGGWRRSGRGRSGTFGGGRDGRCAR